VANTMNPEQRFRLKQLLHAYEEYRKKMKVAAPGDIVWFAENFPDRKYEVIADGVGGARAVVYEGNPCDCLTHYDEHFDEEDDAVDAIKVRAKAGGAWEDEHDEVRTVSEKDEA